MFLHLLCDNQKISFNSFVEFHDLRLDLLILLSIHLLKLNKNIDCEAEILLENNLTSQLYNLNSYFNLDLTNKILELYDKDELYNASIIDFNKLDNSLQCDLIKNNIIGIYWILELNETNIMLSPGQCLDIINLLNNILTYTNFFSNFNNIDVNNTIYQNIHLYIEQNTFNISQNKQYIRIMKLIDICKISVSTNKYVSSTYLNN